MLARAQQSSRIRLQSVIGRNLRRAQLFFKFRRGGSTFMRNRFDLGQFGSAVLWKRMCLLCLALCTFGVVHSASADRQATIITFDAPGAADTGAFQGTTSF